MFLRDLSLPDLARVATLFKRDKLRHPSLAPRLQGRRIGIGPGAGDGVEGNGGLHSRRFSLQLIVGGSSSSALRSRGQINLDALANAHQRIGEVAVAMPDGVRVMISQRIIRQARAYN